MQLWKGQRGFTLIELLAVMAILAVLAGMVAPAVSGTKEASIDAKVLQDATQVRAATTSYFKDQTGSEVRTPHSILTTTLVSSVAGQTESTATLSTVGKPDDTVTTLVDETVKVMQEVSDRWPELFITQGSSGVPSISRTDGFAGNSVYKTIFNTGSDPVVKEIVLLDDDSKTITGSSLIEGYTAIDVEVLFSRNYLSAVPEGARNTSTVGTTAVENFLWLFRKVSSVGGSDDDRNVAVFKLTKVEKLENELTAGGAQKVRLVYLQIF